MGVGKGIEVHHIRVLMHSWRWGMKKLIFVLVILILFAGSSFVYGADVKVIKFANISSMSGPAAPWGMGVARALRLAVEDIGTFTIAGQP